MRTAIKRVLYSFGVTAMILGAVRGATYLQSASTLSTFIDSQAASAKQREEDARAKRSLPPRHGELSGNSCSEAQAKFRAQDALGQMPFQYISAFDTWPGEHLPADVRAFEKTHEAQLAELRSTMNCESGEKDSTAASLRMSLVARHMIFEGMIHAEDGDTLGAVDRELDAIRFGEEQDPIMGERMIVEGVLAMSRTLAGANDPHAVALADDGLTKFSPFAPQADAMLVESKGYLYDAAKHPDEDPVGSLDAPRYEGVTGLHRVKMRVLVSFIAPRAVFAKAVVALDAQLDVAMAAVHSGKARDVTNALESLAAENDATWNPIVWRIAVPLILWPARQIGRASCAFAVSRAVVSLEQARESGTKYDQIEMPEDPCDRGSKIHFESLSDGAGYRVWSVGADGKDSQGAGSCFAQDNAVDDLMVERLPTQPPPPERDH